MVQYLVNKGAFVDIKNHDGKTALDLAEERGDKEITYYLETILYIKYREKSTQPIRGPLYGDLFRHHMSRKPLAIDSSNQREIATSSAIKPSSWINDLFGWVKGSVGGLLNSKLTLSNETSRTSNTISQVDAKMDVNGTIVLLDVLVRRLRGRSMFLL